ncbi:MAG TPA: glycoside hydrolase family 2 TIM barrel-domain containing protein [Solirubrobacteraceae bacterium]|nr:glycoside hydrolase family 2 TIM barrel-domain containing protein [Solirubrobacteraceae bacterium]
MTRRLLSAVITAAAVLGATAMGASAQPGPGPPYIATAPTPHPLYQDGQTGRYLLGGEWLYQSDPTNIGLADGWWKNNPSTTGWAPITVPNAFNVGNYTDQGMNGIIGWYRRDFTLPTDTYGKWVTKRDQAWILRFESVNYHATVWLNGHQLGTHSVAFLPFEFDLRRYLQPGVNRLIVRVDNIRTAADFPPGPGGLWFNWGGILREVYLRAAARADLQQVLVRPVLPCPTCAATIEETATVRNVTTSAQTVRLTGTYGSLKLSFGEHKLAAGASWSASTSVTLAKPHLWSLGHGYLYKATLRLADLKGKRLAGYLTYSGIRLIKVVNGHLTLNGRLLHIRGVSLHEQNITDGSAMSPAQLQQLFGYARQVGATMIRAHYPLNPQLEEMADRAGILLWSEVPVYQTADRYLSQPGWLANAHALLRANILDNQNHPSIAIWSIGNELPQTVDPGEAHYISTAAALAHQLDPTRPVGMAIKDWPGLPCQAAQYSPLDVIGINEYFGWFDVGGGVTDDRDALGPFLDSAHACLPGKAIMITEFGVDGNRNGPVDERGTYAFQADTAAYDLGVFNARPWLSGALYFVLQDFVSFPEYSGGNPLPGSPYNQKGLFDVFGKPKPVESVVSSAYHDTTQLAPLKHAGRRTAASDQLQGSGGL